MLIHGQVGDVEAGVLQVLAGVEHGVVLDGGGDDVAACGSKGVGDAAEGGVVRLGAAAGEHHLAGAAAENAGHGVAGVGEGLLRLLTDAVDAGGVAEKLRHVGQHELQHAPVKGRGARMVHVYNVVGGSHGFTVAKLGRIL